MTLDQQIEAARAALADLRADETELTRLEAEQTRELDELRADGSRDFATRATLEGKRAALASMLAEQRGHVAQAAATLGDLEAQQVRAADLAELRGRVAGLTARRAEVDGLLLELHTFLLSQLGRITAARIAWEEELTAAQDHTAQVFGLSSSLKSIGQGQDVDMQTRRRGWTAAFDEIGDSARAALLSSPVSRYTPGLLEPYSPPILAGRSDALELVGLSRQPVGRFLDRPVSLTVAAALAATDQAAPHSFRGGEQ